MNKKDFEDLRHFCTPFQTYLKGNEAMDETQKLEEFDGYMMNEVPASKAPAETKAEETQEETFEQDPDILYNHVI